MIVRVPIMIQDQFVAMAKGMTSLTDNFDADEDFFLDGPVTPRVAVLDLDATTGALLPGVKFIPPKPGRKRGKYEVAEGDASSPAFMQVSVFGTVLRTMKMFEQKDVLGRPLHWAFDGPQLLVIPRAGEWANAYYERDSRSLQFFHFSAGGQTIFTSLSRDIVSHETGHAILDGIAPDLYHAIAPQSLALHEAIADLTALLLSFQSRELVNAVLNMTGGSISNTTAFNSIAEEFGRALDPVGRATYLRSLLNDKTLDPDDRTMDRYGRPNRVDRTEPHELSEVLSGALYSVIVKYHTARRDQWAPKLGVIPASGKALGVAAERFGRFILRALDLLPPGEVSFADFGRALIAADQASHPEDPQERDWLTEEFVRRKIVPKASALKVKTDYAHQAVESLDLDTIVRSDWAAYDFADRERKLLGIPAKVPFRVLPRLDAKKVYYRRGGPAEIRECIFKVAWDVTEPSGLGAGFPSERAISVGTTLAIDWESRRIRSLLTSDLSEDQVTDRDRMLQRLVREGLLMTLDHAVGPDGRPLRFVVSAETLGDVMRVRGAARMLHITGVGD